MPPRKTATATVEPEETTTETGEKVETDKATVMEWIKEAIHDVLDSTPSETPVGPEEAEEPEEELETSRQQEARMRRTVEQAIGNLHIHVGEEKAKASEPKIEPEATPGKKPFLQRVIGLNP